MSIRMDGPDSECAGLRFVGTHHLSWVRWSKGCKTLTSSQLEGPALFCPLQAGPRFPHARQKHLCSTPRWTECPWNREDAGQTESCSRVWWSQRDGLGSTGQAPRDRTSGTRGATDMYPRWGSEVEHREPTRKAVHPKVGSEWRRMPWCFTGLAAAETGSGSDSANLTLPDGDAQLNRHLQSLVCPLLQRSISCRPLVFRMRYWALPCPRTQRVCPGTPDGAMRLRSERPVETHLTGKLSQWSSSHPDHESK